MFVAGRISSVLALVLILVSIQYGMRRAREKLPGVRRIAGLEAIEEAVGRATEMGKTVFTTPGWADVTGSSAGPTFAALDIIAYLARLTARYDTRLVVAVSYPNVYPLVQQTVQQAYIAEGKPQEFSDEMIRFTSPEQYAYAAACLGMIQRENVAATVFVGQFASEAINFAEAAVAVGAISISGTTSPYQLPFFAAACDYTMIGEELLAAGAYLSRDPARLGSVLGQDLAKLLALVVLVLGVVLKSFGSNLVADLLKQ